jgi:hypothetical protein
MSGSLRHLVIKEEGEVEGENTLVGWHHVQRVEAWRA